MNDAKYIGLDVNQATISAVVLDSTGHLLIALIQTPHRFRTKRQLWAYSGLALAMRTQSAIVRQSGSLCDSNCRPALRTRASTGTHDDDDRLTNRSSI